MNDYQRDQYRWSRNLKECGDIFCLVDHHRRPRCELKCPIVREEVGCVDEEYEEITPEEMTRIPSVPK